MLTAEQLKAREGKLTASRVGVLMSGNDEKILSLWKEMLGLEEPPDLSDIWAVRLGEVTEELNLDWYERNALVTCRGEVKIGNPDWMACTLDGWDVDRACPVECKHVGGREPLDVIIARYMPQMTWQMLITKSTECAFSVIMGATAPIVEYIPLDGKYASELMTRATSFMLAVQTLTPPVPMPEVKPPVIPVKEYDMTEVGEWKSFAQRWQQSYGASLIAKECEKRIKEMVPLDAKKAFGHGIIVTRNRAGSMSLREMT